MKKLELDLGLQSYELPSGVTVRFNPTDANFAQRLVKIFDSLEEKQKQRHAQDGENPFQHLNELDASMRGEIDGLFGETVCNAVFGSMSLYAFSGGIPLWMQLLLPIMDEVETAISGLSTPSVNHNLEKYLAKYRK